VAREPVPRDGERRRSPLGVIFFRHNAPLPTVGLRSKAERAAHPEESGSSQRSYWGADLTNTYAKGSYRQRISHFTEELSLLSESDKDWVMGPRDRPAPEVDMSGAAAVDRHRIPTGRDFRVGVVPPTSPANIAPKPMD
jgi:hypothetical protein